MKQKRLETIIVTLVAILCYCVGYMDGLNCINHPIISVFLTFFPAVVVFISIVVLQANRHKILRSEAEFLSRPITTKTEDGYTINPEDIHEAVEKLGYLEYEKEEDYGIYGDN